MRYATALAMIPVPLLMLQALPASNGTGKINITSVATEGVRAQRQDASTFRLRWSVVSDLPPAVIRQEGGDANAGINSHRQTETMPMRGGDAPVRESTSKPVEAAARTAPPAARLVQRAALRTGICARHGMRKVTYGRRWRCRR
jgi:hypothetical protein